MHACVYITYRVYSNVVHNVTTIGSMQVVNFKPSEPKFKCSCGIGFDFQDDYQVHQVHYYDVTYINFNTES